MWLIEHLQKIPISPTTSKALDIGNIMTHSSRMESFEAWDDPTSVQGWLVKFGELQDVQWVIESSACFVVCVQDQDTTFLTLVGFRGTHHYVPLRTFHQVGITQQNLSLTKGKSGNVDVKDIKHLMISTILIMWEGRVTM